MFCSSLSRTIALLAGVLAMVFLIGYIVLAWQEPMAAPPIGNVDAPLNIGPIAQTKRAGLILAWDPVATGLIVRHGNVGIGTVDVGAKLTLADHTTNTGGIRFRTAATAVDLWSSGSAVLKTGANFEANSHRVGTTEVISSGRIIKAADGTAGAPSFSFSADTNTGMYRGGTDILRFSTAGADRITILADGNVGIGTTNPGSYKLRVEGNVAATAFYYISDINLKTDVQPLNNSLEKILKLQGVSFDWKDSNDSSMGFIAQEVEKIFPEAVYGLEGEKTIDYARLIAPMLEAIKEQQKEIEELKAIIQ